MTARDCFRLLRFFATFWLTVTGWAAQLPVRTYTTADGLPGAVYNIVRDSRGLLWFCTRDGLSRFDGSRFVNYTVQQGLPSTNVSDLIETNKGEYWVATSGGGVALFHPGPPAAGTALPVSATSVNRNLFTTYRLGNPLSDNVSVLYEDRAERLWAGTADGLFRLDIAGGRAEFRRVPMPWSGRIDVESIIGDSEGNLIAGSSRGLLKIRSSGDMSVQVIQPLREGPIRALLFDRQGSLWMGNASGLMILDAAGIRHDYSIRNGPANEQILALHQSTDGRIWIGTGGGLTEFIGGHFRNYRASEGLPQSPATGLAEDGDGNLWISSLSGVTRLALRGFLSYTISDGLGPKAIASVFEDREGGVIAVSGRWLLNRFDGATFHAVQPRVPPNAASAWGSQMAIQDHSGEWWLTMSGGLWRFARGGWDQLAASRPIAIYDAGNSPIRNGAPRMFEDRRGDLWLSIRSIDDYRLMRWERDRQAFRLYSESDGLPPASTANAPFAFAEDRLGRLWVGFYQGGIARYDGRRFQMFTTADGMAGGMVTAAHLDRDGRLWFATNQNGLVRLDDPAAERPVFRAYTVSGGLSSNNARSITEDRWGRIYIGTVRGVDRLDPQTGRFEHYTTGDGLAGDFVATAFCDRHGALWFGTFTGLSCLIPREETRAQPHPVWIGGLQIDGAPYQLSELGATDVPALQLGPGSSRLQIDFFGLSFRMGSPLRYQYQLQGADRDWSAPVDQRSVNYARLSPGGYKFLVRTVDAGGVVSLPASVAFRVLPPFWRSWWFVTLAAVAGLSVLYSGHRVRLAQVLQLEAMRRRLATDLHDDIGTSLSQIAILSEVAQRQYDRGAMSEIAAISREMVDSISDIVWVTNPRHDHLNDLLHRMRRFGIDSLAGRGIEMQFQSSGFGQDLRVGPEIRRQVYLIFKEAITNIARHSSASHVHVDVKVESDVLTLRVEDDGSGFDADGRLDGNGLSNIRKRAAGLHGSSALRSQPGQGTAWTVTVRLARHRRAPRRRAPQH